jgi:hypothetical protein
MKTTRIFAVAAAALCAALISGCSTPNTRISRSPEAFARLNPDQQALVKAGQIAVRGSTWTVTLALGEPDPGHDRHGRYRAAPGVALRGPTRTTRGPYLHGLLPPLGGLGRTVFLRRDALLQRLPGSGSMTASASSSTPPAGWFPDRAGQALARGAGGLGLADLDLDVERAGLASAVGPAHRPDVRVVAARRHLDIALVGGPVVRRVEGRPIRTPGRRPRSRRGRPRPRRAFCSDLMK